MAARGVSMDDDGLDQLWRAVLTLAERQTATLDAVASQGIRLDALRGAVEHMGGQLGALLARLEGGEGGGIGELVDAINAMAADLGQLREGTAFMANAVAVLAQRMG